MGCEGWACRGSGGCRIACSGWEVVKDVLIDAGMDLGIGWVGSIWISLFTLTPKFTSSHFISHRCYSDTFLVIRFMKLSTHPRMFSSVPNQFIVTDFKSTRRELFTAAMHYAEKGIKESGYCRFFSPFSCDL